jgi:hypothetical protein
VVLGAHLLLLAGGMPSFPSEPPQSARSETAHEIVLQTMVLPADAQASLQRSSGLSTVRWLAPPSETLAPVVETPPTPLAKPPVSKPRPAAAETVAAQSEPESKTLENPETTQIETAPDIASSAPSAYLEPQAQPPVAVAALSEVDSPFEADARPLDLPMPEEAASTALDDQRIQLAAARPSRSAAADNRLPPAQPPTSARLEYAVTGKAKGIEYSAKGQLDWSASPAAYTARMEIRVFLLGSRVQTSQGALVASGLQPERFADKSRSERAAHFDRAQGRVRFSNNAPDAELLPGAQDRLSVFFQLAGLLNARPEAYAQGQSVAVPVAGTGGSEVWRFEVQGLESLKLPAGELIARHLVREPRQAYDTRVDIWLAPSLGHLPVRIRITQDNGDVVDQRLSALP